jgi:UDP-3-O-[3-hydroxymyristoyl] glucosamine N-acyltransferase
VGAQFTLGRIAEALGATLEGDPARGILGVAPLAIAGAGHVSFRVNFATCARRTRAGRASNNLVQVAHSCEVGEDAVLVRCGDVSGSCKIDSRAVLPELVRRSRELEKRVQEIEDGRRA